MKLPPYADTLGLRVARDANGVAVIAMPFGHDVTGRPQFLHGGAIAGLLEMAAIVALAEALGLDFDSTRIKPVNVTVDYMRGGREKPTFGQGVVTRLGTRVANVEARAWQDDPARPIAVARMHYLLVR